MIVMIQLVITSELGDRRRLQRQQELFTSFSVSLYAVAADVYGTRGKKKSHAAFPPNSAIFLGY